MNLGMILVYSCLCCQMMFRYWRNWEKGQSNSHNPEERLGRKQDLFRSHYTRQEIAEVIIVNATCEYRIDEYRQHIKLSNLISNHDKCQLYYIFVDRKQGSECEYFR